MYHPHTAPPDQLIEQYYAFFRQQWNPLVKVSDIPNNRPLATMLLGQPLVVAKLDGIITVMDDLCRHFQAALSLGEIELLTCNRQVLRCKYHGWAYDTTGKCIDIPQLHDGRSIPSEAQVKTYPSVIKHGIVWVNFDSPDSTTIPDILSKGQSDLHLLDIQISQWNCSAVRMILSALDDYHFPFLHQGILGDRSQYHAPNRTIKREANTLISEFTTTQPANLTNSPKDFTDTNAIVDYKIRVDMPNVISIVKNNPLGVYVIWFSTCPRSFQHTDVFWTVARSYNLDLGSDAQVIEMESKIQDQDRVILASQRPWASNPLPIRDVDDALIEYLHWLKQMGCPSNI